MCGVAEGKQKILTLCTWETRGNRKTSRVSCWPHCDTGTDGNVELPATVLHQNSILSSGAIGLALKKPYTQNLAFQNLQAEHEFHPNLLRIFENTPGMTASNPAAFRFLNERVFIGQVGVNGQPYRVVHLISGDPSRGGLAVSGDVAPTPGSKVQMVFASL
ncbi:hypothetical protein D9611_012397 [Ephemerocybe angulata]|uniref:Uncharacterized protein n=1 Tax=Ephemerocybe angulata TaxID=980116 RepID=A0A8H5CDY9_9AGAR|nr:hypothetical protein D9611_012397 [Tulosesus angulatus]